MKSSTPSPVTSMARVPASDPSASTHGTPGAPPSCFTQPDPVFKNAPDDSDSSFVRRPYTMSRKPSPLTSSSRYPGSPTTGDTASCGIRQAAASDQPRPVERNVLVAPALLADV